MERSDVAYVPINPMKMARCILELERIYGIQNGGNRGNQYKVADTDNLNLAKTQSDLANQIGVSQQQLQDYKNLIPELQSMVENEAIKATVAYKIWARLSYLKPPSYPFPYRQ